MSCVRSLAGVAVIVAFLLATAVSSFASTRTPSAVRRVALGVYVPDALWGPVGLDRYVSEVGREPLIIGAYTRWPAPPFVPAQLARIWRRGAVPMITWEPWSDSDRGVPLSAIAAGSYDTYIRQAAAAALAWRRPILVRFAAEMNGTWYPWGRGKRGNSPDLYKRTWRHVVGIFQALHADNVQWVWAPNENRSGRFPFAQYYPGDSWVQWVGLDGYNWGSAGDWSSFTGVFGGSYDALRRITNRPVIIAETGSSQAGGDKAAWVASALGREIPAFPAVRAVVWFDARFGHLDSRIDSSPAALRAFRTGASSAVYALTRAQFLSGPTSPSAGPAPRPPASGYGQPSLAYRLAHKLHGKYVWYAAGIALLAVFGLAGFARLALARWHGAKRHVT
jgi:hypothetical protein